MTEADHFAAIRANPDSDEPRLAYAAWLEKNKNKRRAELIRMQCEFAPLHPEIENRRPGKGREEGLGEKESSLWSERLDGLVSDVMVRRGVPDFVTLTGAQFLANADELFRVIPLCGVRLQEVGDCLKEVVASPHLAGIDELFFDGTPTEFAQLFASEHLTRVSKLQFDGMTEGAEWARVLADSPRLSRVRSLNIHGGDNSGFDGPAARLLAGSPHLSALTELDIAMCPIGPEGFRALVVAPGTADLTRLCIHDGHVGDEGAESLAASPVTHLRSLHLEHSDISDRGLEALVRSSVLAHLTELGLSYNRIGSAGVVALAASPALAGVMLLGLASNPIGDEGTEAVAASEHLGSLEVLEYWETETSPRWLRKLRSACKARVRV